MTKETILVETTLEESLINDYYGCYWTAIYPSPFTLTVGETYEVVWDGSTFECVAQDGSAIVEGAVFIGNAAAFGLDGNNEPFIIGGTLSDGGMCNFLCLTDTEPTIHTVAIYLEAAEPANIILRNPHGEEEEYAIPQMLEVDTTDGGTVLYSEGQALENVPVELDFSNGDQTVNAPKGYLVKSAVIAKPEDCQPENIRKDKVIGGIVGTLEAGGGSSGGTDAVEEKDVCFYDYDGTRLYSYTADEIQTLAALPPLPVREGMICQEWTHTLDEIKSYTADCGICDVGATYITDDGKTRLLVDIGDFQNKKYSFSVKQNVANGTTIDWGDGSTETVAEVDASTTKSHTYAAAGKYVISVDVADGCTITIPSVSSSNTDNARLIEINYGKNINSVAFGSKYQLERISLPVGVTEITSSTSLYSCKCVIVPRGAKVTSGFQSGYGLEKVIFPVNAEVTVSSYLFRYCYNMKRVCLPISDATSSAFYQHYTIKEVAVPTGVTIIKNNCFYGCYTLQKLVIPATVTTIQGEAFASCRALQILDFSRHTSVPTLVNSNAFTSISTDLIILVPSALYNTWKAGTNWKTVASYIVVK